MLYYITQPTEKFIGRTRELKRLAAIDKRSEATVLAFHGRRRVGKTELIEKFFHNRNVIKFEGIELKPSKHNSTLSIARRQIKECIRRLGYYTGQSALYEKINCEDWTSFFEILTPIAEKEDVIIYFEEVQWLAAYQDDFLAEMKPYWDDKWRHNHRLRIVFSGSSPSFLVNQFMSDKAFYNRNNEIFSIDPFTIQEISEYLKKFGPREKMLATLCVGGIPEYLKKIRDSKSVLMGLAELSFSKDRFFAIEYSKIFVSSLSNNKYYRAIIQQLAKHKFMTRDEITNVVLGKTDSGGTISSVLKDLVLCGFISSYSPIQTHGRETKLVRYCIRDEYLNFYHHFIEPQLPKIEKRFFDDNPEKAINRNKFAIMMGFAFERWCRNNADFFAESLGFSKIEYESGAFFNRALSKEIPGFQIDLMFIRRDSKLIIAEIKYYDGPISTKIHTEVQEKIRLFIEHNPKYKNYTIETLLITTEGVSEDSSANNFFDYIITLQDIFRYDHSVKKETKKKS